jgi:hypothetical protein
MDTESPGYRSRIIDASIPWIIIVTRTVDNNSIVDITICVTGQVTNIYHFGGGLVNVSVFHIVNRGLRWQFIYLIWPFNANFPGTGWLIRAEPDCIIDTVIYTVNQQNRFVRI